jgi:hypothetical protein
LFWSSKGCHEGREDEAMSRSADPFSDHLLWNDHLVILLLADCRSFSRLAFSIQQPPMGAWFRYGLGPHPRSAISRLVLEIARAGLSPFGQVLVQFMMVWQR